MASRRSSRAGAWSCALTLLFVIGLASPSDATTLPTVGPVAAAAGDSVTFSGHGYGHGRGMGQYGAYGYAVDQGWSYQAILGHYYSNTTLQGVGNPMISVELTRDTGADTIAMGDGLAVNGSAIGAGAVLVRKAGSGVFTVFTAPGCAGPWSVLNPSVGSGLTITDTDGMPTVCESTKTTTYRGSLRVVDAGGTHYTFNDVSTEDYLRGVLPRESPASWGDAGGGRGMQALMAQAVAARSYALAYGGRTSGASICDSESCQVYGGAIERPYSTGVVKTLEDARTNAAVQGTAGVALAMPGGAIARAEFSSSTGGYTAGGTFPAVVDDGDATGQNPNRNWISTIPVGTVASGLGVSSIRSISVTQRNGLGAEGGRVLSVRVVDNAGVTKTLTGNQVRVALGLRSDWFSISWDSPAEAQSVVRAMYMDLLGRGPDPTGLQGWSAALLSGTGQPALVAALTRSDEYIALRVSKAYNEVLGRAPEPAGAKAWLEQIRAGYGTVDDVQRRFYDSDEYFTASGGTWQGYVQRLYTTMLHRGASDAEVASWVAQVSSKGRAWVVDSIWWSFEAAAIRAGGYYQTFLGRGPDPSGLEGWTNVLLALGEGAVRVGIAGSLEYRARAIALYP